MCFPSRDMDSGAISKALDKIESIFGSNAVDWLELHISLVASYALGWIPWIVRIREWGDIRAGITPGMIIPTIGLSSITAFWGSLAYNAVFKGPRVARLVERIQRESIGQENKALIVESRDWRDLGIYSHVSRCRVLADTHSIHTVSGGKKIVGLLEHLPDAAYDPLWIRGHGESQGVALDDLFLSYNEDDVISALAKKVRSGATVIFESCMVGKGEENFAQFFSARCPDATIYANEAFQNTRTGLEIREGIPHLKDFFGVDSTRIYKNGTLLSKNISDIRNPALVAFENAYDTLFSSGRKRL